ncbi:hypothetical protein [Maribacter sp. 2307ULW6-5]
MISKEFIFLSVQHKIFSTELNYSQIELSFWPAKKKKAGIAQPWLIFMLQ